MHTDRNTESFYPYAIFKKLSRQDHSKTRAATAAPAAPMPCCTKSPTPVPLLVDAGAAELEPVTEFVPEELSVVVDPPDVEDVSGDVVDDAPAEPVCDAVSEVDDAVGAVELAAVAGAPELSVEEAPELPLHDAWEGKVTPTLLTSG